MAVRTIVNNYGPLFSVRRSCMGGFSGSSLGSLEPPFLKLLLHTNKHTELADIHSSFELRSAVQSRQIAQT